MLSRELAKFIARPARQCDDSLKLRSQRRNRTLQVEPLEVRQLMDAGGLASLVSPSWFQDVPALVGPLHAGVANWTTDSVSSSSTSAIAPQSNTSNLYDWIVQFDTNALNGIASVAETTSLLVGGGINFQAIRGLGLAGQVLVRSSGTSLGGVAQWLAGDTHVASFEQDAIRQIQTTSNDPQMGQLWGLNKINAAGAWGISTGAVGSNRVVVAVIDTGVDYNHPDLAANIWTNSHETVGNGRDDDNNGFVDDIHGYDFANNDGDPMDDNSHGTHVSGTIAGVGNNSLGVAGVNWSAAIMPLKFLDGQGSGYLSNAVRAINYATMERTQQGVNVRVINASWGGGGFSSSMDTAIRAAGDAGILFVAAAGNDAANNDTSPHYPANYASANVISVAATDQNDQLASFSDYGATTVNIAAPGVTIYSTLPNNRYGSYSGTSMATPHVAGVAALAWAVDPDATVADVRNAILQGADSVAALSGKVATGGRLNAYNTLLRMSQLTQGPTVASMTASSGQVAAGASVTLIAHGITSSAGTSATVNFYRDANGSGQYDASDLLVGSRTTVVGGEASLAFNTTGLATGTHRFFAVAVDSNTRSSPLVTTTLSVTAADDHGNNAAAATAVNVGGSIAGAISTGTDVDWFKFQAVAGTSYTFSTQLGTLRDSVLSLYDRNGTTRLAYNDDYGGTLASRIVWTASTSGTYYVAVAGYSASNTGAYTLVTAASSAIAAPTHGNSAATATAVNVGGSIAGAITTGTDVDWFKFQAVAGTSYTFSTQLGTLRDSVLSLYDRNGTTRLAYNDDYGGTLASRIVWTASTSGTYYVAVAGYGTSNTGTYTLVSSAPQVPAVASRIDSSGQLAAGASVTPATRETAFSAAPGNRSDVSNSLPYTLTRSSNSVLVSMASYGLQGSGGLHNASDTLAITGIAREITALLHDDIFTRLAPHEDSQDGFVGQRTALDSQFEYLAVRVADARPLSTGTALRGATRLNAGAELPAVRMQSAVDNFLTQHAIERHIIDDLFESLGDL